MRIINPVLAAALVMKGGHLRGTATHDGTTVEFDFDDLASDGTPLNEFVRAFSDNELTLPVRDYSREVQAMYKRIRATKQRFAREHGS